MKIRSIRLNNILREEITYIAIYTSKRFRSLYLSRYQKQKELTDLFNTHFDEFMPKDDIEVLQRHELLETQYTVDICTEAPFSRTTIGHYLLWKRRFNYDLINDAIDLKEPMFKGIRQNNIVIKLSTSHYNALLNLNKEVDNFNNQYNKLYRQISADYYPILEKCNTTKQVFEYWPQGIDHFPLIEKLYEIYRHQKIKELEKKRKK